MLTASMVEDQPSADAENRIHCAGSAHFVIGPIQVPATRKSSLAQVDRLNMDTVLQAVLQDDRAAWETAVQITAPDTKAD